jgi:hypothetical protein
MFLVKGIGVFFSFFFLLYREAANSEQRAKKVEISPICIPLKMQMDNLIFRFTLTVLR